MSSSGQTTSRQSLMLLRFKTSVAVISSPRLLLIWVKTLSALLPWMVPRVLPVEQKWLIPALPSWFQLALLRSDASWMSLEDPLMSVALSRVSTSAPFMLILPLHQPFDDCWGFGNGYQGRWSPCPLCSWWKDWSVWRCWCREDCIDSGTRQQCC